MGRRWFPVVSLLVGLVLSAGPFGHGPRHTPPPPVPPVAVSLHIGVDTAYECGGQLQAGYHSERLLPDRSFEFVQSGPAELQVFDYSGRFQSPLADGPHGKWIPVADYGYGEVRSLEGKLWWTGDREARSNGAHFDQVRVRLTAGAGLSSAPYTIRPCPST